MFKEKGIRWIILNPLFTFWILFSDLREVILRGGRRVVEETQRINKRYCGTHYPRTSGCHETFITKYKRRG
jgi:hypothetical protein